MNNYILGVKSVKEQNEEVKDNIIDEGVVEKETTVEVPPVVEPVIEQKEVVSVQEVIDVEKAPTVEAPPVVEPIVEQKEVVPVNVVEAPIVEEIKDNNEPLFSADEREELNDNMIEEEVIKEQSVVETAPIAEEKAPVVEQRAAIAPVSNNNYDTIERDFIDEKEEEATIVISPTNSSNLNMGMANYKLAESMKPKTLLKKRPSRGILRSDVGIRSGGFAGIASIGALVAFGALIIMYLAFRF